MKSSGPALVQALCSLGMLSLSAQGFPFHPPASSKHLGVVVSDPWRLYKDQYAQTRWALKLWFTTSSTSPPTRADAEMHFFSQKHSLLHPGTKAYDVSTVSSHPSLGNVPFSYA